MIVQIHLCRRPLYLFSIFYVRYGTAIDTASATGKLTLGIFAALAEFERELSAWHLGGIYLGGVCGRKDVRSFKIFLENRPWQWQQGEDTWKKP